MTPQEAKKILFNQWQSFLEDCIDYGGISEAYKMAFKALEQESITWIVGKDNCQVAVRNMPIDKMQKICAIIGDEEQQPCEGMRDATEEERKSTKDYIDSISKPTGVQFDDIYEELNFVQPQPKPKSGKWKKEWLTDSMTGRDGIYRVCSECGYEEDYYSGRKLDFCPHCGADMRGESE